MKKVMYIIVAILFICSCKTAKENLPIGYKYYIDNEYNYSLAIPDKVDVKEKKISEKMKRISFIYDEEEIYVYSGKIDGNIDYKKLPDILPKLVKLGKEVKRESKLFRTEISFDRNENGYYCKVITNTRENNYYIIAAFKKENTFGVISVINESFKISKYFSKMSIINMIGFISLILHIIVLNVLFGDESLKAVKKCIKEKKIRNFEFWGNVAITLIFVVLDIFVTQRMLSYLFPFNIDGLYLMTVQMTPYIFTLAGQMISEGMASVIGFGFWPGGNIGIVLTTIFSIGINIWAFPKVVKKMVIDE